MRDATMHSMADYTVHNDAEYPIMEGHENLLTVRDWDHAHEFAMPPYPLVFQLNGLHALFLQLLITATKKLFDSCLHCFEVTRDLVMFRLIYHTFSIEYACMCDACKCDACMCDACTYVY